MNREAVHSLPQDPAPVALTPAAQAWLIERLPEGHALRLGVKGGGCAGLTPTLDTVTLEQAREEELAVQDGVVALAIEPEALDALAGAVVDLESSGLGHKLVIRPAPDRAGCGCGLSFRA